VANHKVHRHITALDYVTRRTAKPLRAMVKPRPLLATSAELLNAANGVQPLGRKGYVTIPTFAFGWPTTELAPLYLTGSVLDAVRRGLLGHFKTPTGRAALVLKALTWAASGRALVMGEASR
jgi:hypothetical protein